MKCKDKRVYYSLDEAEKASSKVKKKLYPYQCESCGNFHLSKTSRATYAQIGLSHQLGLSTKTYKDI